MTNTTQTRSAEAAQIQALATAMHCYTVTDECGDRCIQGQRGNIHVNGAGYSISVMLDTSQQWTWAKKKHLAFCQVKQDGETEGVVFIAQLPTVAQAETLRDVLGVRKIRELGAETVQAMTARLAAYRFGKGAHADKQAL